MNIQEIHTKQLAFFNTSKSKDVRFRIEQLKKFKNILKENESLLYKAIYDDFGKSQFETYATELSLVYNEINSLIKNTRKWSKRRKVRTGLANLPARSYIMPEPLGVTLIIGAWNYPYQISLIPAISSLAAGNTVILKPSELPSNTSAIMAKLINNNFASEYFCVIEGGVEETTELLKHKFDKIFFTGSIPVGKIIYESAAKHLTPVTLELGGKSPTFVLADTDIKMTAKRIVWSKFLNAGQTCVAPDYLLVEQSIQDEFLKALTNELKEYPTDSKSEIAHYLKIINTKNFDRLNKLIDKDKIFIGGQTDRAERFISPTILKNVSFEDEIMKEEIFGPILPIISFTKIDEAIKEVKKRPKPLSCYIYSKNRNTIKKLLREISFGGGAINDSVMHLSNSYLPFGGVGLSGMGSYHGKFGFDTFSHLKGILQKSFLIEPNIKYPPYSKGKLNIIKWLME